MPQSLSKVALHNVFSTKNRHPFLEDSTTRQELYAYMATVLKEKVDSPAILINGVADHIHALCLLSRKFAIMSVIEEMKTETSKWLKRRSSDLKGFSWQTGYGVFSVSESNIPAVKKYIENQDEHHKRLSFQDEYRKLCKLHHVEIDERYVWD